MKILIYGAGVIGSFYALLFKKANFEVSLYARGKRLDELNSKGFLYLENELIKKIDIQTLSLLKPETSYDFIFLAVRENQLYNALKELKITSCPIVTFVNSTDTYSKWEAICGKNRIIPAFPGAGGSLENGILKARLTPRQVQATTFGEINGEKTERLAKLAELFKKANIPYHIVDDMHLWQLCHLAMVVPLADAYYNAKSPKQAGKDYRLMLKTAKTLKENFYLMKKYHHKLSPPKMNLFLYLPTWFLARSLSLVYKSNFANTFMYPHALKAQDEMNVLHQKFYTYIKSK